MGSVMHTLYSRQHFLRLAASCGLAAATTFAVPPRAAQALAAVGSVTRVKGTAALLRNGEKISLSGGEEVAAGDVITTLAESRARIALGDGSQINLGELTKVTIAEFEFEKETLSRAASFDLKSGLLQAITAKAAPGSSFLIRTSNAVAATRSTDWIVEAKKAQTSVFVLEGKVDVAEAALGFRSLSSVDQDKAMLLEAGHYTMIGKASLGEMSSPKLSDAERVGALQKALALD